MHFLQAINSDISVLIVCNKTGGTIKGDIKKKYIYKHRKCTHILLGHHFINNTRNTNTFQPLEGHLQGAQMIPSSSVGQQNVSPVAKYNLVCTVYCVTFRVVI